MKGTDLAGHGCVLQGISPVTGRDLGLQYDVFTCTLKSL